LRRLIVITGPVIPRDFAVNRRYQAAIKSVDRVGYQGPISLLDEADNGKSWDG
jgi:hypothetical protein